MTKTESSALLLLIAIGITFFLVYAFFESFGFIMPALAVIGIIAVVLALRAAERKKRLNTLMAKYGDQQVVERILNKTIWVGETSDQLI
jgi:predicted membrane protein